MSEKVYAVYLMSDDRYSAKTRELLGYAKGDPEDIRRYYQSTHDNEIKVYEESIRFIGPDKRKKELEAEKEALQKQLNELDEKLEYV